MPQETDYRNYQLGQAGMSSQTAHSANSAAAQIAREQEQLKRSNFPAISTLCRASRNVC
ncbi:hypothetical protein THIOSC13_1570010 [uncultured Thiomicrorhabdus sp.]